jgi:hypothetical protein
VFLSDTIPFFLSVDVTVKYKAAFNLTKKSDGLTYLQPLTYDMSANPKGGSIHFEDLFNGNKLLGETHVLQFSYTAVNFV